MPAVDFEAWAIPPLRLLYGGVTYEVAPPSTEQMGKLFALAVLGEARLRKQSVPDEVQSVLDTIGQHEHPALGDVHQQMVAAGLHPTTIDRAAYYSVYYWTHGRQYADAMARLFFEDGDADAEEAGTDSPKA
ncbi:hypothetical protein C5B92_07055 [Rathayibacter sp. AY1A4]|uniref:DUF7426 family protein n=1 Tax=Rathayibacter sp. AY1A4 TaxID=2080522 RepID=UPI000CE8DB33|nr:hypothetical protein [Rathayibacter sp. AY1A4]PPF18266.1 hypothetical protein C5B92_07055 [Rathayibacter sp. AY1A4]